MSNILSTTNMILHGFGHYNNNSYYSNGYEKFDKSIPLIVGESLSFLGFKVEIAEVNKNDIVINVYKYEFIEKKNNENIYDYLFKYSYTIKDTSNVYIERYNYTSGRYEDFQIDSGEFVIRLKEEV